jgi:hypothetical protein
MVDTGRAGQDQRTGTRDVPEDPRVDAVKGTKIRQKVYVSGPISGRSNHNREAFDEACRRLRDNGYYPVNPLDCTPRHTGGCRGKRKSETGEHTYGCYLLDDLNHVPG